MNFKICLIIINQNKGTTAAMQTWKLRLSQLKKNSEVRRWFSLGVGGGVCVVLSVMNLKFITLTLKISILLNDNLYSKNDYD